MLSRLLRLPLIVGRLGVKSALTFIFAERLCSLLKYLGLLGSSFEYGLTSRLAVSPLWVRFASSDRYSFSQIFIDEEYGCVPSGLDPVLIVDCGANVGYASAYFASRFPSSSIIAIEPDQRNYAVLQRNVASYGTRVTTRRGAVWAHPCGLKVVRGMYRDGLDWSTQVRECEPGETPDVAGFDIETLLSETRAEQIDILKVDIERAERVVFGQASRSWLPKVKLIVIELHDDECRDAFLAALRDTGLRYSLSRSGEMTIAERVP